MKYGILLEKTICTGYRQYHDTFEDAKRTAFQLSKTYKINVTVFEVIGRYEIKTMWSETE